MSVANGVMFQTFTWTPAGDGRFWDSLGDRAADLADAGFTALWLPPPCKAAGGTDDVGYGLYDLYDLGEFDQKGSVRTRYGTRDQLQTMVTRCQDAGLITLADIVLNHRMGADETETFLAVKVNADHRTQTQSEPFEFEAWTRYDFPGREGEHSDFGWRWHHFTAVDTPAHGNAEAGVIYRVQNKEFADDVGQEMSNYDYLMGCDINLTQDDVRQELFRWGNWLLDQTGLDGFRVDAAKHMSAEFLRDFLEAVRHGRDAEVFSVAEYAIDNVTAIESFISQTRGTTHCFDFPLHFRFHQAGEAGADFDLRTIFDCTLTAEHPTLSVSFVENHDTEPAQGGDSTVADWFKPLAYALILLRREGFPCVFAGDYDGRAAVEKSNGDGPSVPGLTSHRDVIDRLLRLRHDHGHGPQHDFFHDPQRIGWVRTGDDDHPGTMVVVLNNADEGELDIDTGRPDTAFRRVDLDAPDDGDTVKTDDTGHATFPCPPGNLAVYLAD